jgi:uncharacterized membrane protein
MFKVSSVYLIMILSYYMNGFLKNRYRWEKKEFAKAAAAKKGTKQNMGEELLILNY